MISFIEKQFPVSKISKESYKERKANNGQTLTGLGKWWGRKPLVMVRAAILGSLMPASDNPKLDMEIFLKIMSMDKRGLELRKEKPFSATEMYEVAEKNKKLRPYINEWFDISGDKIKLNSNVDKKEVELIIFNTLGYDEKLKKCIRPEQLKNLDPQTWREINNHLNTSATNLQELIEQLSIKRYGRNVTVGDCFCGGGSIPFEASRMGCETYASDLNPVAGLLTWAGINILGASEDELKEIKKFQEDVFNKVDEEITKLGIEHNENGDRAVSYLYCVDAHCPECDKKIPLAPSWVIGKGTKTVAKLIENENGYDIIVKMGVNATEMKEAANSGTVGNNSLICPSCGKTTPIASLRKDRKDDNGNTIYGLRQWEKSEFDFRDDDIYGERLYAIKYERADGTRYYRHSNERDLDNENKVKQIVKDNIEAWQEQGLVPSMEIESGMKTDELMRNRGWTHWNHLFNARQLLTIYLLNYIIHNSTITKVNIVAGLLGINRCINYNSKLCRWLTSKVDEHGKDTFYNQALNSLYNYAGRALIDLKTTWFFNINDYKTKPNDSISLMDARLVNHKCHLWITDPPYADAVNYHELSEFFLSWDKKLMQIAFPEWYTDSKRILAVKGDEHFSQSMIDIYSNLARHMYDDGSQIVMFTHSDPAVWAQLALIMWKSGLKVTAAWNIATETESSGLKEGNYVKGTVLLVLRKQTNDEKAYLNEIKGDIKTEVKTQIESMQELEDKEEPNFSDPDYVLAAYAASLKVLTSYNRIGELDLDYELNLAINEPENSKVVQIIEDAKKIAYDCIIPTDFDRYLWKDLSHAEKFYIKGLEAEKHNNYQISTYQEYARGFSIGSYKQLMANEKANSARLKTATEFAMRTINEVPDFEKSTLRTILVAIHIAIKEDETPEKGLFYIKNQLPDYWSSRDMVKQLLLFIKDTKDIENMPHWTENANMSDHLYVLVDNDHI
jgi:adenine-specific DNA methylase